MFWVNVSNKLKNINKIDNANLFLPVVRSLDQNVLYLHQVLTPKWSITDINTLSNSRIQISNKAYKQSSYIYKGITK